MHTDQIHILGLLKFALSLMAYEVTSYVWLKEYKCNSNHIVVKLNTVSKDCKYNIYINI